jgi:hypothetical protein
MSTKTTFKRIALVAVATLGFGTLSVVPSQAATELFDVTQAVYIPSGAESATHTAGPLNYVVIGGSAAVAAAGGTSYSLAVTGSTFSTASAGITIASGATTATIADSVAITVGTPTVRVMTPTVGTITVTISKNVDAAGVTTTTVEDTLTITVTAASPVGVLAVAKSTSLLDKDATAAGSYTAPAADEAVSVARAAGTAAGVALLTLKDGNDVLMPTTTVTAVVTGPGTVSLNSTLASADYAGSGRVDSGTTASGLIYAAFYGDGTSGVSTITISVGTTVVATETVTFYGSVAKLTATVVKNSLADDAAATAFASISATDSTGVAVPLAAADGAPSTTNGTFTDANGATAFLTSVELDPTADALGTKTTTWTHTASGVTIDLSVVVAEALATGTQVTTMTTDKLEYTAGEKITVTIKSVDASGNIMADGAGNYLTAAGVTATQSIVGTLPAQSVTLTKGVATYTVYAPLVPGPVTLSGVSAATAATAVSATFTVLSDGIAQAAVDAAAEAIDAANAATDAANAAAEAADAATAAAQDAADAVAALSVSVAAMIDALKKQITSLTNLVIKIQKKVKA